MKITEFISGFWVQQYQYKSFSPSKINHSWLLDDEQLCLLLSKADKLIGELNAFSVLIPDVDIFIKMHIYKEATESSRIEGTQTNIEEALQKIQDIAPEKKEDWHEVSNYVKAMNTAIQDLQQIPLCARLLRKTHQTLMQNVRGENKQPGDFRTSQNWIGGVTLNDSVFVPPHFLEVSELMSDLEQFLQNKNIFVPDLIKVAIAHYQFETIHPFCDGNGRIGRLLITLYLVSEGILCKPTLYLSSFFAKHKHLYYDKLMMVRHNNDMLQWLNFFLQGVIYTTENSINIFKKIIILKTNIEKDILTQSGKNTRLTNLFMNMLWKQPVIDTSDIILELNIGKSTAIRLINNFLKMKILKEITGYKRNRVFVFDDYVKLFL